AWRAPRCWSAVDGGSGGVGTPPGARLCVARYRRRKRAGSRVLRCARLRRRGCQTDEAPRGLIPNTFEVVRLCYAAAEHDLALAYIGSNLCPGLARVPPDGRFGPCSATDPPGLAMRMRGLEPPRGFPHPDLNRASLQI